MSSGGSTTEYDLTIIGMGSGGMVAAEFAASLGRSVAVVERDRVGGDCLWTGCVPSKALLASARVARAMRRADEFGLTAVTVDAQLPQVWQRVRRIQDEIAASDDDPQRFVEAGIDIIRGSARMTGPHRVMVEGDTGEREIESRFVLLCTGSRPAEPAIHGLAEVDYLTNETFFDLEDPPTSIVFVGGGPIAAELSQGCARLGITTTLLQRGEQILPREEPELAAIVRAALEADGVGVHTDTHVTSVERTGDGIEVTGTEDERERTWRAQALFVAAGRRPQVEDLGLEAIGVGVTPRGVDVDERMRTAVPSIYAAGDVAGRYLFTHAAGYEAVRAVRDMFFPGKGKADSLVPWCTFTEPELARAGLTVAEARARHGDDVRVWSRHLSHIDRARCDGEEDGSIVIVCVKDRIVGAHIAAPAAGEMIHELALAIQQRMKLSALGSYVHVYPTVSTGIFQLAGDAAFEKADKLRWLIR